MNHLLYTAPYAAYPSGVFLATTIADSEDMADAALLGSFTVYTG